LYDIGSTEEELRERFLEIFTSRAAAARESRDG
jgi:hypothetical protein